MDDTITKKKLAHYFDITGRAMEMAKASGDRLGLPEQRADFLDMITRYYDDARHFESKGDFVNAFAALSYAHGWLDAGARLGLFDVKDSVLFTVDDD
jgi:hypothetical protein